MGLFLLIILGVAIYFIFFSDKKRAASTKGSSALDILKEKFINGDIDEEEYKRKKSIIGK